MLLRRSILSSIGRYPVSRSFATVGKTTQYTAPSLENNEQTESNRLSKTLTKFWNEVQINSSPEKHEIQLDSKTIRTPLGNKLVIPSDRKILAHLLLHEWASLSTLSIKTHQLPLTSLASRVIDLQFANSTQNGDAQAKVGVREDIVEDLLRYLDTDTLLVFSPQSEYEGKLRSAQEELYRPVIKKVEEILGDGVELTWLDTEVGLRGNKQTEEVRDRARKLLLGLDYWDLVALEKVTLSAKSLICGLLVLKAKSSGDEVLNLEEIAKCATLEIVFQTEKWGEVEDTHDVDYQDIRRNIASAAILSFRED